MFRQGLAAMLGLLLTASFVAGAAAMGVLASTGGRMPQTLGQWVVVAGSLMGAAVLAFGPATTLGQRRYLAALVMLPVWCVCAGFSNGSINKFASENLLDAEAQRARAADDYKLLSDRIEATRRQRLAITELRSAAVIASERAEALAKVLRDGRTVAAATRDCTDDAWRARAACAEVAALATAAQEAHRRETLDAEITALIERRAAGGAVAGQEATQRLQEAGWILMAIRQVSGLDVRTPEEARAVSLAWLVWLGEMLMPVSLAMARGRSDGRPGTGRVSGPIRRLIPGLRPSGHPPDEIGLMTAWIGERIVRERGRKIPAGALYSDFADWCRARGRDPPHVSRFGVLLTDRLRWQKRKHGKKGLIHYFDVSLQPVAGASPAASLAGRTGLSVLAGGRVP